MMRLNLQFFGGRGTSGQSYKATSYKNLFGDATATQQAFKAVAGAPIGSTIRISYLNGGDSTYVITQRGGGKKTLQLMNSDGSYNRGRVFSTPATIKNITGSKPTSITVATPKVNGKQAFKASQAGKRTVAQSLKADGMRKRAKGLGVNDFKTARVTANGSVPYTYTNPSSNQVMYGFITKNGNTVTSSAAKQYFNKTKKKG